MENSFEAKCPCGDVILQISGAPLGQVYCHCDDCQSAHGAAYVPRSIHQRGDVSILEGNTKVWTNVMRDMVICSSCGSHLFSEHKKSPVRGVNAGNFPPDTFSPTMHLHCKYAVAKIDDDLPHFCDLPSEFEGTGKLMVW